jgi:hypothetical protein
LVLKTSAIDYAMSHVCHEALTANPSALNGSVNGSFQYTLSHLRTPVGSYVLAMIVSKCHLGQEGHLIPFVTLDELDQLDRSDQELLWPSGSVSSASTTPLSQSSSSFLHTPCPCTVEPSETLLKIKTQFRNHPCPVRIPYQMCFKRNNVTHFLKNVHTRQQKCTHTAEALQEQAKALLELAEALQQQTEALLEQAEALMGQAEALMGQAEALLDQGEALLDQAEALLEQAEALEALERQELAENMLTEGRLLHEQLLFVAAAG